jgi:hypothetical protein
MQMDAYRNFELELDRIEMLYHEYSRGQGKEKVTTDMKNINPISVEVKSLHHHFMKNLKSLRPFY